MLLLSEQLRRLKPTASETSYAAPCALHVPRPCPGQKPKALKTCDDEEHLELPDGQTARGAAAALHCLRPRQRLSAQRLQARDHRRRRVRNHRGYGWAVEGPVPLKSAYF